MKINILILLTISSIFFISCDKNMKRINPFDEGADRSEIDKICKQSEAECGYITANLNSIIFEIDCGECPTGYECSNNNCFADSSDSQSHEDADINTADTDNTDPTESSIPECSKSSDTPCYDPSSGLTWSKISSSEMDYIDATIFCEMNNYGGFTDWRLPNIDELKTLLTSATGSTPRSADCKVSETNDCLALGDCWTCSTCTEQGTQESGEISCLSWGTTYDDGRFSKLGDSTDLWSSSTLVYDTNTAWLVFFDDGSVASGNKTHHYYVRCVR